MASPASLSPTFAISSPSEEQFQKLCSENQELVKYIEQRAIHRVCGSISSSGLFPPSGDSDARELLHTLRCSSVPSSLSTFSASASSITSLPVSIQPTYSTITAASSGRFSDFASSSEQPRALDASTVVSDYPKATKVGAFFSIEVDEEEYQQGVNKYKNTIIGRVFNPIRNKPFTPDTLQSRLMEVWELKTPIRVVPLGKGFYNIQFYDLLEKSRVFSKGIWGLKPGTISLRRWVPDFNPYKLSSSLAEVWIRVYELSLEYWSPKLILGIASAVGNPIKIDRRSTDGSLGHFTRVLVEMDLKQDIQDRVMVVRKDLSFFVGIKYENLPSYCTNCGITGHDAGVCRFRKPPEPGNDKNKRHKSPSPRERKLSSTDSDPKSKPPLPETSLDTNMEDVSDNVAGLEASNERFEFPDEEHDVVGFSELTQTSLPATSVIKTSNSFGYLDFEVPISEPFNDLSRGIPDLLAIPKSLPMRIEHPPDPEKASGDKQPLKSCMRNKGTGDKPSGPSVKGVVASSGPQFQAMNRVAAANPGDSLATRLPKHSQSKGV